MLPTNALSAASALSSALPSSSPAAGAGPERRTALRHYLTQPLQADLIHGRDLAVASGRIGNVSARGLGLRIGAPLKLAPGTPITIATRIDGTVLTIPAEVSSVRDGVDVGLRIPAPHPNPLDGLLGNNAASATVNVSPEGIVRLGGRLSMSARHPVTWAIRRGAHRLDLSEVTGIDSVGIGLLLLLNERHGIAIGHCPPAICETFRLCSLDRLCTPGCTARERR